MALDLYLAPQFSTSNKIRRLLWNVICGMLFRHSPRPLHGWRTFLLRSFGAKLGPNTRIYPKAQIWAPWNLICADTCAIADGAIIYNPQQITLGSHSIVSQQAYLCGATHDYEDPAFALVALPITLGAYSWVCARATVQSGVNIGEGAILALGAVATRDLEPWGVYAGIPARKIKRRLVRPKKNGAE